MTYALMLAQPSGSGKDPALAIRQLQRTGDWTFEFKYDGIRAVVIVNNGDVQIWNRHGRNITHRYPEIVARLRDLPVQLVLDGEIVCPDANGRPDFHLVHRRDAQETARAAEALAKSCPAQLVAFDLLEDSGVDQRRMPYHRRREHLVAHAEILSRGGVVIPPVSPDGLSMWEAVRDLGLEGLIAKRDSSQYLGRRSAAWVKIKRVHRLSALVSGYDRGEGSRASTFGSLHIALVDGDPKPDGDVKLVPVGSVGSGFSVADIDLIWGLLQRPTLPVIIVEVEYLELSPTGQLRIPVFKGLRTDLEPMDCSTQQLHLRPKG